MARPSKSHVRHPLDTRKSLCGRRGARFSKTEVGATCKECQRIILSGDYEKAQFEASANNLGTNEVGVPKLTEKQRAFAAHPEVMINPRKAARDAGYSESFAKSHSISLRKQLYPLIVQHQEEAKKRAGISVAKVQSELAAMGFANIVDYFNVEEDGTMIPKQMNELTREQAAAIQEVKLTEFNGKMVIESLKLADKRANLVELGKSMGMFMPKPKEDESTQADMLREVPTETLEEAERMLLGAVKEARRLKANNQAVEGEFTELPPPGAVEA